MVSFTSWVFILSILTNTLAIGLLEEPSCGRKNITNVRHKRLANGQYASEGEFPWHVAIHVATSYNCGGTLLNARWILTAAHCIKGLFNFDIKVTVGEYILNINEKKLPANSLSIDYSIIHPKYSIHTEGYDLALVRLAKPVKFGPHIQPICLPEDPDVSIIGKIATVIGWGRLYRDAPFASVLHKSNLPIIKNAECENIMLVRGVVTLSEKFFVCAGYKYGKRGICKGDSGGALQLQKEDGSWFITGIASWNFNVCGGNYNPSVFTKVSTFVPWIRRTIYKISKETL